MMWLVVILGVLGSWSLVVVLIRLTFIDRRPVDPMASTALAELDGRLARGEITPEDHAQRRRMPTDGR